MRRNIGVFAFLIILLVLAIIIAIFAFGRSNETDIPRKEYLERIEVLNDTIKMLKDDIAKYQEQINRIDLEREAIKKELELIIRDNEKTDAELSNGDWDTNIKFLTDFLSKKDSIGE